ncbi:hypothetical protein LTR05_007897 [Lithohypha guttulata]|uniref:Secreted protein n=1 Tax=Lithohypha guttulata TaxID=1690604 RepID=A0AAN7SUG0_9EURO|nr:hypothetical protein LTR05_007897 [Lithohypha guttulata]
MLMNKALLVSMTIASTALASSIKWCNEANLKGNCATINPASTFCSLIPDSNAKGDIDSSVELKNSGDISFCVYCESDNCTGQCIDFTGKKDLRQSWIARSYYCIGK